MALNQLCESCQNIFRGHWLSKNDCDTKVNAAKNADGRQAPAADECEEASSTLTTCSPIARDRNGSSESEPDELYEQPDWLRTLNEDPASANAVYESPIHHDVDGLELSAKQGCHLCKILWDKFPTSHTGHENGDPKLWRILRESSRRLKGVVVVRPYEDNVNEHGQVLCLEISYFLDGNITQHNNYLCTIELDLVPEPPQPGADNEEMDSQTSNASRGLYSDPFGPMTYERSLIDNILEWIGNCKADHDSCANKNRLSRPSIDDPLPTRLLDLGGLFSDLPMIKLIASCHLPKDTEYATLSHCWGENVSLRLLEGTLEEFCRFISVSKLPRTFREAAFFASMLGIRYLWIDALCIIQDSDRDWSFEAVRMPIVYQNACVSLAANASSDGSGGLFRPSDPLLTTPCMFQPTWSGLPSGRYLHVDDSAWRRRVEQGLLNQRAWVLQERLLAPRTIHFAKDQVWWECCQVRACEKMPQGVVEERVPIGRDVTGSFAELCIGQSASAGVCWVNLIQAYTSCALSHPSDKLIAISGLAQVVGRVSGRQDNDYLAGLWRDDLPLQLLWRMKSGGKRLAQYRAPSWSWASVEGEVYFSEPGDLRERPESSLEILDVHLGFQDETSTNFGRLKGGFLRLATPYLFSAVLSGPDISNPDDPSIRKLVIGSHVFEDNVSFAQVLDDETLYFTWPNDESGRCCFICVVITVESLVPGYDSVSDGLILERVAEGLHQYRRIGWIRLFHDRELDSSKMREQQQEKRVIGTKDTMQARSEVTVFDLH